MFAGDKMGRANPGVLGKMRGVTFAMSRGLIGLRQTLQLVTRADRAREVI